MENPSKKLSRSYVLRTNWKEQFAAISKPVGRVQSPVDL